MRVGGPVIRQSLICVFYIDVKELNSYVLLECRCFCESAPVPRQYFSASMHQVLKSIVTDSVSACKESQARETALQSYVIA
jgi:hypothetical protein